MPRYDDGDLDDMIYEIEEFLESHKLSELMKLITDVVEIMEYKAENEELV